MSEMILIYVVCKDIIEAKDIGKKLLEKRLLACVNILTGQMLTLILNTSGFPKI